MQSVEPRITKHAFDVLGVDRSVKSRTSYGGTAPANVRRRGASAWLETARERAKGAVDDGDALIVGAPPSLQMVTATQARASDGCAPSCCVSEYKFATPQCSMILPLCTRMASTASKRILRPVGAMPRNVPWCVPW